MAITNDSNRKEKKRHNQTKNEKSNFSVEKNGRTRGNFYLKGREKKLSSQKFSDQNRNQ